jgi:hypothetical protein
MVTLARGGFSRRVVTIAPGDRRPYVDEDWRDALVVIVRGAVDLECTRGGRRRFEAGTMMSLEGLGLVALFNPGPSGLVIIAITRAAAPPD